MTGKRGRPATGPTKLYYVPKDPNFVQALLERQTNRIISGYQDLFQISHDRPMTRSETNKLTKQIHSSLGNAIIG